jgi:hypothetical protein
MGGFVHRLGNSFQAVGPGIQAGAMTIDVAGGSARSLGE